MYKLQLQPDSSSYSVTDGTEVVSTSLDGGAGRYRRDIVNASSIVTCQWTLNRDQYQYIRAFYRSGVESGSLPFLIDLVLDMPYLREFEAYFIPNSMKLSEQKGYMYRVSANLEVTPLAADTEYDLNIVTLYSIYNSIEEPEIFGLLSNLVNVIMPLYIGELSYVALGNPASLAITGFPLISPNLALGAPASLVLTPQSANLNVTPISKSLEITTFIPVPASGGGSLTTLTVGNSATSSATTIICPAVNAGDLIVLLDRAEGMSVPTTAVPTNFVSIVNSNDGAYFRQIMSYKIATGSEGGTSLTGMVGSDYTYKGIWTFTGDIAITGVTALSAVGQSTDGNPSVQTVTSGSGVAPLLVFGAATSYKDNTAVLSMTPTEDAVLSPDSSWQFGYKIYNSSPSNVSVDMADAGYENCLQSCYLEAS